MTEIEADIRAERIDPAHKEAIWAQNGSAVLREVVGSIRFRKNGAACKIIWSACCSGLLASLLLLIAFVAIAEDSRTMKLQGIHIPKQIGDFFAGDLIDNEEGHPGLGQTIPFHHPDGYRATVFVYNFCIRNIPDGALSDVNRAHFDQVVRDVFRTRRPGEIELIARYGTGTPEAGVQFLCAEFKILESGHEIGSYIYLASINTSFLKVRITNHRYDETDTTPREFVDALAQANGV